MGIQLCTPARIGRSPRHEPGPRRGAVRRRRVAARQPQSFARKLVEVGRLDLGMTVTGQVTISQIIRQHDQEVRPLAPLGDRGRDDKERQKRDDRSERHGRFSSRELWFPAPGTGSIVSAADGSPGGRPGPAAAAPWNGPPSRCRIAGRHTPRRNGGVLRPSPSVCSRAAAGRRD